MRKSKLFGIMCCIFIVIAGYLYVTLVEMRKPEFILNYVTPDFENEAEFFFAENVDILNQLSMLKDELSQEETYYYDFHVDAIDSPNLPQKLESVFTSLENSTEQEYTVIISNYEIIVYISTGTNYEVYLYYGPSARHHGIMDDWNREKILTGGWKLCTTYILRG